MNAQELTEQRPAQASERLERSHLQARRRAARRRLRLARLDLATGVIVGLLIVLIGPGYAIDVFAAVFTLSVAGAVALVRKRRRRRRSS